jgi:hypothetical protein
MQEVFKLNEIAMIIVKMMLVECEFTDENSSKEEYGIIVRWATNTPGAAKIIEDLADPISRHRMWTDYLSKRN